MLNRILIFLISMVLVLTTHLPSASAENKESIRHEVKYRIISDDLVEVQMIVHAETDGEWTLSINGVEADKIERGGEDGHNSWAKAQIPVRKTKNDQYRIHTQYTGGVDPYFDGAFAEVVTLENELTFSMKDWQFEFEPIVVEKNRLGGKFIDADQVKGSWFIHVYEPDVEIKAGVGSICAGGKRDYSGTQFSTPFYCWKNENKPGKYRMQVMFDGKVDGQDISLKKSRLILVDEDGEIFYADGEPKESDPDPDYNYSLLVLTGLLVTVLGVMGWWWLRKRSHQ
ncbi:hypothetical protein [Desmospora activa]|uniref:LPXTG-motif cell wall-anchored protein n=1 Tax=Desmospora activa DSM 45169 TaxID=1121389 RepID=A0A2T4Z7B7_9BACL|nr:hypothetical protein [Desmospora activa]PTM57786.1 hypothetical protein C8J48_0343 [Desmospora activa DSM 45169]